jgi:homoserine dehydrogenase
MGDEAQLIMVMHQVSEKRFEVALEKIAKLKFLRSPPRAIRVIEEEFN